MSQASEVLRKHLPTAASVAVGIVPLFILALWFDVSRKIIGRGAMAYAAGAVGLKLPLYHLLVTKFLHKKLSHKWLAAAQGLVSACSELGAAFCFFLFVVPELTFAELLGFGVAAGSVEAIILPFINPFQGTPLEQHADETSAHASNNMTIQWLGVLERVLASLVHVGARGLVYVSYATGNFVPVLLAVLGFASVDGRGYYAHLQKWAFDDSRVLAKFYLFLAAIGVSLTLLFVLSYSLLP